MEGGSWAGRTLARRLPRSWMTTQPTRQPGTRYCLASPLVAMTGTVSVREAMGMKRWPSNTMSP